MHKSINHVMTYKQYIITHDTTHPNTYNLSDSADACTCGGLSCSTELIVTVFLSPTYKVSP